VNTGRITGTTNFILTNPLPITRQLLDRGEERFQIYCLPCHGPDGDGKGITAKYGMVGMADFHDRRLVEMKDGEIFSTMTSGLKNMPAYGPIIPVEDRWAILTYVRVLQRSQLAVLEDVPEQSRSILAVKK
jgi:mono/diheme cytochrome c family protein